MPYQLHEPFPSLSSKRPTYMHTGRGGAGNLQRATATDVAKRNPSTGPQSFSTAPPVSSRASAASSARSTTFMTGRGGAGNAQPLSQRALFSFDEELERLARVERDVAPVYHIGRGGAGNLVGTAKSSSAGSVSGSDRKGSMSSEEGVSGPSKMSGEWLRRWRS